MSAPLPPQTVASFQFTAIRQNLWAVPPETLVEDFKKIDKAYAELFKRTALGDAISNLSPTIIFSRILQEPEKDGRSYLKEKISLVLTKLQDPIE